MCSRQLGAGVLGQNARGRGQGASAAYKVEASGTKTLSSCQARVFLAVLGWGLGLPPATGLCMKARRCGLWDGRPLPRSQHLGQRAPPWKPID